MDIIRCVSTNETKERLAAQVSLKLALFQKNGAPTLFLFSGGSALPVLDMIDPKYLGRYLTMAPVDERYDPTDRNSNFAAFMETALYGLAKAAGVHFIDTRVKDGQERGDLADFFERALRGWRKEYPDGKVIVILGMGPDGHTAGIFPTENAKDFSDRFEGKTWTADYAAPPEKICPERVTTTVTFLQNEPDAIYCYVCGEEKRSPLTVAIDGNDPLHKLPIGVIRTVPNVQVFTDLRL